MTERRSRRETRRRFRMLRVSVELTQIQVAVKANMSLTRYREIENGYGAPMTPDEDAALRRVFRVESLLGDEVAAQ